MNCTIEKLNGVRSAVLFLLASSIVAGCSHKGAKSSAASNSTAAVGSNSVSGQSGTAWKVSGGNLTNSSYRLPEFQEKTLANGLRILFVPNASLPFVSYSLLLHVGAVQDPEGLSGLTSLVSELLDKGTTRRKATQIAEDLGQMGADFSASSSTEFSVINASGLSNQADQLVSNLFEIVTEPTFSDVEIERIRKRTLSVIDQLQDNPEGFGEQAFERFLFAGHPYSRPVLGTLESVATIKKKNIIQQYLRYFRPNNAILAVVGKFTPELADRIEHLFGGWQAREISPVRLGQPVAIDGLQFELIDKPGMVQAQVHIGNFGISRKDPDFLALKIANTILGGVFKSRLIDRIRGELGLTYMISSSFETLSEPGPFQISTFTKNETVGQIIDESLKTLHFFRDRGVSDFEVEQAKSYVKGVFPTAIETPEKLAFNLLLLRFYGIPDTYLTNFLSDVDKLTTADINAAIKKHIDADNLKILVYGTSSATLAQLSEFAKTLGGHDVVVKKASELR